MPTREELLEATKGLTQDVHELTEKITALEKSNKSLADSDRSHKIALYVIGIFTLVVAVLGVLTAYALEHANDANNKATRSLEYEYSNCLATNQNRVDNTEVWAEMDRLINTLIPEPRPSARVGIDKLRAKVEKTFILRDCEKVREGQAVNKGARP